MPSFPRACRTIMNADSWLVMLPHAHHHKNLLLSNRPEADPVLPEINKAHQIQIRHSCKNVVAATGGALLSFRQLCTNRLIAPPKKQIRNCSAQTNQTMLNRSRKWLKRNRDVLRRFSHYLQVMGLFSSAIICRELGDPATGMPKSWGALWGVARMNIVSSRKMSSFQEDQWVFEKFFISSSIIENN